MLSKILSIFFVSETHLPTDDEVQVQVNGFMLISKSRASGQEGGVGAYISSSVLFHRRLDLEEDIECIRLEILFPKTKDLLLELFIALLTRRNISDQITQANLSCVIREQRMHIHRWYTLQFYGELRSQRTQTNSSIFWLKTAHYNPHKKYTRISVANYLQQWATPHILYESNPGWFERPRINWLCTQTPHSTSLHCLCSQASSVIQNHYVCDGTVIFTSSSNFGVIERNLNDDINNLATWFAKNELIVNLKKGKTETMIFGTAKRGWVVSKVNSWIWPINSSTYKYFGVHLDPILNFETTVNKTYKKAAGRVTLRRKVHSSIACAAEESIYRAMITLSYSNSRRQLIRNIEHSGLSCISPGLENKTDIRIPSVDSYLKRKVCLRVFDCLLLLLSLSLLLLLLLLWAIKGRMPP